MIHVLDASAVLRFLDKEPGAQRIRDLLHEAAKGRSRLVLSAANWGELVHALYKRDATGAERLLGSLQVLPIEIIGVDADDAAVAGKLKWKFRIPYVDALAAALTFRLSRTEKTALVTADYDFKPLQPGVIAVEFLPAK
jgi:ribonuclease VapC